MAAPGARPFFLAWRVSLATDHWRMREGARSVVCLLCFCYAARARWLLMQPRSARTDLSRLEAVAPERPFEHIEFRAQKFDFGAQIVSQHLAGDQCHIT